MPLDLTDTFLRKILPPKTRPEQDFSDSRQRGLVLRCRPTGLHWLFRTECDGKLRRLKLGSYPGLSIADARRLAADVADVVRRKAGDPDEAWISGRRVELGIDTAPPPAPEPEPPAGMTFAQARALYLDGIRPVLRPATVSGYRQFLSHAAIRHLDDVGVASITRQQLARIVETIHRENGETQAVNVASALRPMFSYLGEDARTEATGVVPGAIAGLKAPRRSRVETKRIERNPGIADAGRLLAIARCGVLAPTPAFAIQVTVLTAQRRLTVVQAKTALIGHDAERPEHYIWRMPAQDLKTGERRVGRSGERIAEHEISLPPAAIAVFEAAKAAAGGSEWLFPQVRPQRKGDAVSFYNESSLTHAIGELPDIAFSPHDLRRTFTTAMRAAFPQAAAALILDHSEGRSDGVTGRHYDRFRDLDLKLAMMTAWCDAVEESAQASERDLDVEAVREHLRVVRLKRRTKVGEESHGKAPTRKRLARV